MTKDDMQSLVRTTAQKYGIRPELLLGLVKQESGFDPSAKSSAGAVGLAQLMPGTARDLGLTVTSKLDERLDPVKNVDAGARYLRQMLGQFGGSERSALQAYNWGPGNMKEYLAGAKKTMPDETRDYAGLVLRNTTEFGGVDASQMASVNTRSATVPSVAMNAPKGGRQFAVASNPEEANLMTALHDKGYPEHVQEGMVNVLSQLLPARDMVAGKDLFASIDDQPDDGADLPSDYDHIINEIIDKA